jgi:hypothetical protein
MPKRVASRAYTKRGGIELLEGADSDTSQWQAVSEPPNQLFRNPGRIREEVRIAMEPLGTGG